MNETQRKIIQDLADLFTKRNRVLSRREYERDPDKPFSIDRIYRHVGWAKARDDAAKLMAQDISKAEEDTNHLEDRPRSISISESDGELSKKTAMMAGLRRGNMSKANRRALGQMIEETEMVLRELKQRKPTVFTSGGADSACLVLSDLHCGKLAQDDAGNTLYNRSICVDRLDRCVDKSISLLKDHLKPGTIDEVCILLAGDIVDGSGVYDTQFIHQDIHYIPEQLSVADAAIWHAITKFRRNGWKVRVYGVRGNHGRQGKYLPEENNFDIFLYQNLFWKAHYEDPEGIDVKYSFTEYINMEIKGKKGHMRHVAPPQAETPAARAKYGGWQKIHDWDFMVFGHKHHPGHLSYLDLDVIMNGSIVGIDDLAESMATFSRPSQTLFGINPKEGVSFRYNIYAEELH